MACPQSNPGDRDCSVELVLSPHDAVASGPNHWGRITSWACAGECGFSTPSSLAMRVWSWLVVAACGLGLMLLTSSARVRPKTPSSWSHGLIVLGPDEPTDRSPPGEVIPARLRLLPGDERTEAILRSLGRAVPGQELSLQVQLRPKLIGLPLTAAHIGSEMLASGRLPAARDEVLAGPETPRQDRLTLGDRTLTVVGRLRPDAALFARSYLVPRTGATDDLFPGGDPSVHPARLIRLTPEQMRQRDGLRQLEAPYPATKYTRVLPLTRLARGSYYLYLTGQA